MAEADEIRDGQRALVLLRILAKVIKERERLGID
jgi:hypothetical protein